MAFSIRAAANDPGSKSYYSYSVKTFMWVVVKIVAPLIPLHFWGHIIDNCYQTEIIE